MGDCRCDLSNVNRGHASLRAAGKLTGPSDLDSIGGLLPGSPCRTGSCERAWGRHTLRFLSDPMGLTSPCSAVSLRGSKIRVQ